MAINNANNNSSYGLTINTPGSISGGNVTFSTQGIYDNFNQPFFSAYLNTSVTGVTGNDTVYTVVFDVAEFDQYSEYNTSTGGYTPTNFGVYAINYGVTLSGVTALNTLAKLTLANSPSATVYQTVYNPGALFSPTGDTVSLTNSVILVLGSSQLTVTLQVSGEITDNVGIVGAILEDPIKIGTYFSAIKIL